MTYVLKVKVSGHLSNQLAVTIAMTLRQVANAGTPSSTTRSTRWTSLPAAPSGTVKLTSHAEAPFRTTGSTHPAPRTPVSCVHA